MLRRKLSAASYAHIVDKDTHTNAPVHFLDSIPVSAMFTFAGKLLGRVEGRVHVQVGQDKQERCVNVPGKEKRGGAI